MKRRPIVAEIIGVSGAGKSTLSGTLNRRNEKVKAGLTVWGLPFRTLLVSAFLSIPNFISLYIDRRHFRRDEIKQIIRLTAFYRRLKKEIAGLEAADGTALFLDEGVVFALAKLHADADRHFTSRYMRQWEHNVLNRWSSMLDAVIWLDAPDELLVERIRTRAKLHRMKHKPDDEVFEFLARYRTAYELVIAELKKRGELRIVRIDTENFSSDEIADEILCLLSRTEQTPIFKSIWPKGVTNEKAI